MSTILSKVCAKVLWQRTIKTVKQQSVSRHFTKP
jgi:hypothetical protein